MGTAGQPNEDNIAALINLGMNPNDSLANGAFGYEICLDADDPINSAAYAQGQSLLMQLYYTTAAGGVVAATGNVVALIERFGPTD